jgi:hypothetical protein
MLALPASAAERRTEGLRAKDPAAMTEVSSVRRYWHRRHVVVRRAYWGPRYGYGPYWGPNYRPWYAGYPFYRPYWYRPYAYRPYWYRPYPAFSVGFGVGPRWWW